MLALTFQDIEKLSLVEAADPRVESPGDVVVRVRVAGICGSDLHVYHGRETGLDRGTIMGHEFVGEIVDVGPEVEHWRRGDTVLSPFTTNCGKCVPCSTGLTSRCEHGQLFGWVEGGIGLHGCQAELVRVPLADSTLVAAPGELAPEVALFAGDILATGYFGADAAGVRSGSTVAVVGCGPVGLMAVIAALDLGAATIWAIDRIPERLRLAAELGAVPVDLEHDDLEALGARGRIDAVVEAVGSAAATRLAFDLVRPGGTISAVGVHTEPHLAFSPGEAYDKNLSYRAGRCPVRRYVDRALALAHRHEPALRRLISHRLPLGEGVRGYELFAGRTEGCTKVVLLP
jgi:threonine dehydrogenase-like Zn-dependent dehydrogenase